MDADVHFLCWAVNALWLTGTRDTSSSTVTSATAPSSLTPGLSMMDLQCIDGNHTMAAPVATDE